jgi:O-antigen ligase
MLVIALPQQGLWQRVLARAQPELQLDGVSRTSTEVRALIIETAWQAIVQQPLVGVGYYNFEKYSTTNPTIRASTAGVGYGTHNTYLEVLVEGGLLAFVPLLLHFASYGRGLKQAWRMVLRDHDVVVAAALAGLLVVLISAAVANVLLHYLFWSICGVALACLEWVRNGAVADATRIEQTAPSHA